jgi:subtilisin family serine protease
MVSADEQIGAGRARLQPKLQMIANGSSEVNAVRAERCAGLQVTSDRLLEQAPRRRRNADMAVSAVPAAPGVRAADVPRTVSLAAIPSDVEAAVFVHLNDAAADDAPLPGERARKGDLVSARVALDRLPEMAADPRVAYVEIGEALKRPTPVPTPGEPDPPPVKLRQFGNRARHGDGADVLIGIIDVGGFDFSHQDFLDDDGGTRFVAIWDQGGDARPSPGKEGTQFGYGAELLKKHLDAALAAAPGLGVPAWEIERQSQLEPGSHGTHVASIAAGNRGVSRRSPIAAVLLSLPAGDQDRRRSFYDSTRLADAVDYLVALAGERPLSINISLGTNGHAHDGAGAIGRWLDAVLATPGRAITVAAGNAGQERAETRDDIGFVTGRVHTAGVIAAADLTADIEWVVVGNGIVDISENELELWFSPQDRLEVTLRSPQGETIGPVGPREFVENRRLADGSFVSIYNELYHPANGANYMALYLSPNMAADPVIGVPAGTWTVRLRGVEVRDGRYDGWIERDDPAPVGVLGPRRTWAFPSFFGERSTVDTSTVSSLGCGQSIVTVANLDEKRNAINITSSQGPTRDGRFKPDVAAPGTDIVAARAFGETGDEWIAMSGTSMASPYVTGLAGLMLATEPRLTAAQVEGIIRSTAKPLPGGRFAWVDDAGFGVVDPARCLEQAGRAFERVDKTRSRSTR